MLVECYCRYLLPSSKMVEHFNESYVLHTSSADFAGSEMPYLLNAITRNVYVVDGTRFW